MKRRFTNRQIVAMVAAVCATVALAPVGALAATGSLVNITDPQHTSQKARVTSAGRLATAPCDSNSCAAIDSGTLRVGDGGGSLTVAGSVLTYPSAKAFSVTYYLHASGTPSDYVKLLKPGLNAGTTILVTSVTLTPDPTAIRVDIEKQIGADTNCQHGTWPGTAMYFVANAAYWSSGSGSSFHASFPSPVRVTDRCALIVLQGCGAAYVTVTGYVSA
jgi:hypothetical protein